MTDDRRTQTRDDESARDLSRRDFVALSVAAALATATNTFAQTMPVAEKAVEIKTPDGTAEAMFIHPTTGTHPGVLVWPDAFGLRPAMRDIGARIAAEGYAVLVPNPFYRSAKATVNAPLFDASFDFGNQNDMAKLKQVMGSIQASGAAERDAAAYIAFLDAQSQVNKARKVGTQGYCMGGALVVRTAASLPIASAPGRRSTVVDSSPTHPTALIVWRRRSKRGCISGSQPTTTAVSRVRRTI